MIIMIVFNFIKKHPKITMAIAAIVVVFIVSLIFGNKFLNIFSIILAGILSIFPNKKKKDKNDAIIKKAKENIANSKNKQAEIKAEIIKQNVEIKKTKESINNTCYDVEDMTDEEKMDYIRNL